MKIFESYKNSYIIKDNVTNPNIKVGDYTYYSGYYHKEHFEDYCVRYLTNEQNGDDQLIIGKFCSIGSGAVFIMSGNQGHRYDWVTTYPFFYDEEDWGSTVDGFKKSGDTIVGNDVWIGTEAIIMPGVKIGDGAVIGSRSVVTKDVPPYAIVAGNPAKLVKKRFTDNEITNLLEIKWWNWSKTEIKQNMNLLCSNKIRELYKIYKARKPLGK